MADEYYDLSYVGLDADDSIAKKHQHTNKTVLDNTEASYTTAEETKLSGIEAGATTDQDISGIGANATAITEIETKTDFISVSQAVDLDTMESNISSNNSKTTNQAHTGEVTGATALTIVDDIIDEANLKIEDGAATNGQVLMADSTKDGGLKWSGEKVSSDETGITGADQVTNIMSLTQSEYDAIVTPVTTTLYFISG